MSSVFDGVVGLDGRNGEPHHQTSDVQEKKPEEIDTEIRKMAEHSLGRST